MSDAWRWYGNSFASEPVNKGCPGNLFKLETPGRPITGVPRQTQNAVVLLGARWHGDLGILAPILPQFIFARQARF